MHNLPSGMYLIAATVWACMALGGLYVAAQLPDHRQTYLISGFAAMLVVYNLFRWWTYRRRPAERRPLRPAPARPVSRPPTDAAGEEGRGQFPPLTD